jgi:hypothetical protein
MEERDLRDLETILLKLKILDWNGRSYIACEISSFWRFVE